MKSVFSLATASLLCLSVFADNHDEGMMEPKGYMIAGISLYTEKVESLVGAGTSYRLGLGTQLTEKWGLEALYDDAPAVDAADVTDIVGTDAADVETHGNRYLTFLVTHSFQVTESTKVIGKVGYTTFWKKLEAKTQGINSYELRRNQGAPAVSVSLLLPSPLPKSNIELSFTQFFGDEAESFAFNTVFRYQFN